jgi:hypothetical protein
VLLLHDGLGETRGRRKPSEGHEAAVRIANKESTRITDTPSLSL